MPSAFRLPLLLAALLALPLAACGDVPIELNDSVADGPAPVADVADDTLDTDEMPHADPAPPTGITSVYTDLDLDACEILTLYEESGGVELRCPGHDGIPLYVSEGDLRFDVDAGVANDSFDTPSGFNTLGPRAEWRLENGVPFAVIYRANISGPNGTEAGGTSDLAVITIGSEGAPGCLVGFVPASALPTQNEAARLIADTDARTGVCANV